MTGWDEDESSSFRVRQIVAARLYHPTRPRQTRKTEARKRGQPEAMGEIRQLARALQSVSILAPLFSEPQYTYRGRPSKSEKRILILMIWPNTHTHTHIHIAWPGKWKSEFLVEKAFMVLACFRGLTGSMSWSSSRKNRFMLTRRWPR